MKPVFAIGGLMTVMCGSIMAFSLFMKGRENELNADEKPVRLSK